MRTGRIPATHWLAVVLVIALGLFPITLALLRLWAVTGISPVQALFTVHQQPGAMEALRFSMMEAFVSTVVTGRTWITHRLGLRPIPVAHLRLKRALLFLPFVTPPIVAAVGFLALLSPDGFFTAWDWTCAVKPDSWGGSLPPPAGHTRAILWPWLSRTCGSTCRWWCGLLSRWWPN